LIPQDPSRVYALIDVDANVPVRADTQRGWNSPDLPGSLQLP